MVDIPNSWMVYFMETPKNWWFRGTPILGNLHVGAVISSGWLHSSPVDTCQQLLFVPLWSRFAGLHVLSQAMAKQHDPVSGCFFKKPEKTKKHVRFLQIMYHLWFIFWYEYVKKHIQIQEPLLCTSYWFASGSVQSCGRSYLGFQVPYPVVSGLSSFDQVLYNYTSLPKNRLCIRLYPEKGIWEELNEKPWDLI
jgi:hypothetical protein